MTINIKWEDKGIYWKCSGIVTAEEIFETDKKINGDSRCDDVRYQIIDLLDVTDLNVKAREVTEIAHYDKAAALSNPRMKIAIVSKDETIQSLASLYLAESMESQWKSSIFNTIEDALEWVK